MDPNSARAAAWARTVAEQRGDVVSLTRFPTGLCHMVFDVVLAGGERLVVRVASPQTRHLAAGAVAWSGLLRPAGVPLPELLGHDVSPRAPLPYLVLERLPGDDLGVVFPTLTAEERIAVAGSVAEVQEVVSRLPLGSGYGYSCEPAGRPPLRSWPDVVLANLSRSGDRLQASTEAVRRLHAAVLRRVLDLHDRVAQVPPTPFLDDLTTKNVIVDGGRFSGIVDVDVVCFGDPLLTPALTRVSLVASAPPTDYVDAWLDRVDLPGRDWAFDLYCAVFCLDLLSEAGQVFNRDEPVVVDRARVERLTALARECLG